MNVSSSTSTSSTSSLGDTSISGFGGLVSGLDRDSLIKQMASGTQTKITKQQQAVTKAEWKRDAYREITDKVIDFEDNYLMYSSDKSVKNTDLYAKSKVTAVGDEDATKFIKASGVSDLTEHVRILGVSQMASSASVISGSKGNSNAVQTLQIFNTDASGAITGPAASTVSTLSGKKITFGYYDQQNSKFIESGSINLPKSYKDDNDETVTIDYTQSDKQKLVDEINKGIEQSGEKPNGTSGNTGTFRLKYDSTLDKVTIDQDAFTKDGNNGAINIKADEDVLSGLGFDTKAMTADQKKNGVSISDFNTNVDKNTIKFSDSYVNKSGTVLQLMVGNAMSINFGGESKKIELLTNDDLTKINTEPAASQGDALVRILQKKIDNAFGGGNLKVSLNGGTLSIETVSEENPTFSVEVEDASLRKNLGLTENASNKVSQYSSIYDNMEKLGFDNNMSKADLNEQLKNFTINGTKIEGITADTTVRQLMTKINASDAGVKATYMDQSNQFVLLANQTGSGHTIQLEGASDTIFNGKGGQSQDGKNAKLAYDYGNGVTQTLSSSSNNFTIDGLTVTVSGTFGYKLDSNGMQTDQLDTSKAVSFQAKADTDTATERVKKFIEDYNAIVDLTHSQMTTRPTSGYDPLTDDQKKEMSEKQIEEWEKKAKTGILYNDNTLRGFSDSLESVLTTAMGNGISYQDMESIGISMSDDYNDGGKLVFDESKFKAAMDSDPDKVSRVLAGDGNNQKGLVQTIEDSLTPYATRYSSRNGNSYGTLVEEAGTTKLALSVNNNNIYRSIKEMNDRIKELQDEFSSEKDRYKSQFDNLETLISKMNTQQSYITGLSG